MEKIVNKLFGSKKNKAVINLLCFLSRKARWAYDDKDHKTNGNLFNE